VGDARALVSRYGEYRAQLAEFVGNVLALYQVAQDLPTLGPTNGLVRVLHVSDVHLNPTGKEDGLVPPENSVILSQQIPNAELAILSNASHMFHMERPETTVDVVSGFINGQREWLT
jgi:hypothetical protein